MRPGAPPQSRRYVFTGPGQVSSFVTDPPRPRRPPALRLNIIFNIIMMKFYVSSDVSHTHPAFGRVVSMQMRWRWVWEWRWNESENEMKDYLTRTRGGERKRRGKEQTPTPTHLAWAGQTLKGQGKKAEAEPNAAKPTPTSVRLPRHAQDPTYLGREERMK